MESRLICVYIHFWKVAVFQTLSSVAVIQVKIFPIVTSAFGLSVGVLTRVGIIAVPQCLVIS